jgi:hypothetical protein
VYLIASLVLLRLAVLPLPAWNIPGHILAAAMTYQVLQQENPSTIEKVRAVLEKHPWYANQWQARLQDVPVADRDLVLFMQASRWADDIRTHSVFPALRKAIHSVGFATACQHGVDDRERYNLKTVYKTFAHLLALL